MVSAARAKVELNRKLNITSASPDVLEIPSEKGGEEGTFDFYSPKASKEKQF